ncbi:hypothetical protein KM043_001297 [Ampulex compressa]|nr:hypothetical protein KM043_001297 [Ampulex compressa]
MDVNILKAIIESCESVSKDLQGSEQYQKLLRNENFLLTSDILNGLCTSMTKLLCYKVSKEAYQRYAVRLHIIDVLRDWCRMTDSLGFQELHIFKDEEQTIKFVSTLLEKHLSDDTMDNCNSYSTLVHLCNALLILSFKNPLFAPYVQKLLVKLTEFESTDDIESLMCYALRERSKVNLTLPTIEQMYIAQKSKLVEQPLLDHFVSTCPTLAVDDDTDNLESMRLINDLFELSVQSPCIFQLVCYCLKELFVHMNCAPIAMDFVQSTLKRISVSCENQDKNIIDLYPRRFHSCIILLRIEPMHHTSGSKEYTVQELKNIFIENKDYGLILLLHFPAWLETFDEYFSTDLEDAE